MPASAELGAGGDGVVKDHKVQLLLAVYLAHGGEQHTVGLKTHHLARGQIQDSDDGLADELLRFIELADTGEDLAGSAAAVVEGELKKLIGLLDGLAGEDLAHAHVALGKVVDRHIGQHGGSLRLILLALGLLKLFESLGHVDAREERLALADLRACREHAVDRGAVPAAAGLVRADLRKSLIAALGHEGAEEDQRDAQRLKQVIHDRGKASLLALVLCEHPGGGLIDVLVRALDEPEDLLKREVELELVHLRGVLITHGLYHADKLIVHRVSFALRGDAAAEILLDHGRGAADEVAEVVCKVGIDGADKQLIGEVAVGAEGEGAQQEEAQRIDAEHIRQHIGIDDVALGLGHLAAVNDEPAVAVYALGQGQFHAHEHCRPDDGVEADDLLADDVYVCRPVLVEIVILVVEQSERSAVVEERIDPDVYDVTRIKVHRHAPVEARAGDAEVFKARLDEVVDHLVDARGGLEKVGVLKQVLHAVGVLGKLEEVGLFLGVLDLAAAVGALAVNELALGPEALAGLAVLALVGALVDVAVVVHLLEDLLDGLDMVVIRCADEAVVRNIHELPQIEDALFAADDVVDELLRGHARGFGLIFDLLAVLVGAGQEHDVIARQALVARHRVGRYGAVGVADVELVGGVVDGGRDIEFLLVHWCFPLFCPRRMKAGRNYLQSTTERAVFARFYRIFPQKKKARRHKHRTFSI